MTQPAAGGQTSGGAGAGRRIPLPTRRVRVTTAAEARACDDAAIARGIPSRALMRVAGHAAAIEITRRYGHNLARGVAVYAGPGNNGGDAWVVAQALAVAGVPVSVRPAGAAKSPECVAERAEAERLGLPLPHGGEEIIVDGLLGVGARGAPTGEMAEAIAEIRARRAHGAIVVALDLPSGVEADSGETHGDACVQAHCTLTFGTVKRGLLVSRAHAGAIVVLDIGLAIAEGAALTLVTAREVRAQLPPMGAASHKGTRGKVVIVGGAGGMSGAVILAARAALAAGAGLVKVVADPQSLTAIQAAVPQALTAPWPETESAATDIAAWADALVIGPGLGAAGARPLVTRLLAGARTPVVLDADALTSFAGDAATLARLLAGREALITPHVAEFARLTGASTPRVLADRFDVGRALASTLACAVLLKGVPTVVTSREGEVIVSATGTPALATGGSGDVLAGLAGALLAVSGRAPQAGLLAAWLHGRAAEVAQGPRSARAITLDDVLVALPSLWEEAPPAPRAGVLAELPAVRET